MILKPALLNPLRFIDTSDINAGFDGDFFNRLLDWYQDPKCYFQPFNITDKLVLQFIADEAPTDLVIVDALTNIPVDAIGWTESTFIINNPDYLEFKVYEIDFDLVNLGEGKFYGSLGSLTSEAFEVKQSNRNTVLIKYKHSINDYDVVFATGIEFQFRTEGKVDYQSPKNDRDVYFDQIHNATQLGSVAFRSFKLYVGYSYGVPSWVLDKVNQIQQCDQVSYNDIPYQVTPEAEWEAEKNTSNEWMGANIEMQPVSNNFLRFDTSNDPSELTFTPLDKVTRFTNKSDDFNVTGVFKDESLLEKIWIKKYTGSSFVIKFGTTAGGNDIGEFTVDTLSTVKSVEWSFTEATAVYVSGLDGVNTADIIFYWQQLDEPPVPINGGVETPTDYLGKGALMSWTGSESDFTANWDTATGLGKDNTKWSKWCIAGTNGTVVLDGKVLIGIDATNPMVDYSTLGDQKGAVNNQLTIAKANLPAEGLATLANVIGSAGNIPTTSSSVARARAQSPANALNYEDVSGGGTPATLGLTANMGSGTAIDITPDGVVTLFIVKLED